MAVAVGLDPDGDGPIEALLTPPLALTQREQLIAAVNTNPWRMILPPPAGVGQGYVAGGQADISGWVGDGAATRSPADRGHASFWIDERGCGHIGEIGRALPARCAVAGFARLLENGQIVREPSRTLHPRTALGLDAEGRWLTLVVVDGRQPGTSEGVSERELAEILLGFDCRDAINLDGGGSSVLLYGEEAGSPRIRNRPSDAAGPRPVPVLLGVRRRIRADNQDAARE
jgi:hypothetical protein